MSIEQASKDYILRVTAAEGMIRGFFADVRDTAASASAIHSASPVMSAALGRLLAAGAIMGATLKNENDLLTLIIKGDGPGEGVLVTADSIGNVKGYCGNPQAELPLKPNGKLDVSGALGAGTLTVIKDTGLKEPYNGTVKLQTGEIAEDLAYYFAQSEQTPSAVALGVLVGTDRAVKQAGGVVLQLLPGASDDVITYLERAMSSMGSITSLFEEGHTPETLAELLLSGVGYAVTDRLPLRFHCDCSKERVEKALVSLGKEELAAIIKDDKSTSVSCHFCNKEYVFSEADLRGLIAGI